MSFPLKSSARVVLALAILLSLFWFVGAKELLKVVYSIEISFVIYLLLLAVIMIWVSCLKWRLFIQASGHDAGILQLMRWYTVGYFFNTFTPSYVGGDVARSIHLGKHLESQKHAFVATFLERFTGLLAMSILGVIFVFAGSKATRGVELAIIIVGLGALLLAFLCYSERAARYCFRWVLRAMKLASLDRIVDKAESVFHKLEDAMRYARKDTTLFFKAMAWSFCFHCLTLVNTYVAARAIGWHDPSLTGLFVVVPLVLLVGMAPITPSGLGIQEGAFLFFLMRIGGTRADSLSVGLILRAKVLLIAILGGLLFVMGSKAKPKTK